MTLTTRASGYLGAISATCVLLVACMPADGAPVPPPPVSQSAVSATPPETAQEREERLAYEAAEKAYRTFAAEYARLQQQVEGPNKPTKLMKDNAAGPYLKAMSNFLRYKAKNGRHVDKAVRIAYVRQGGYSKEELILLTCQDGSQVRVFDKSGKRVGRGSVSKLTLHARPVSGRWKIWSATQEVAESCLD